MKKLLIISLIICSVSASAQTYVQGYFSNGKLGKKILLTDLTIASTFLTAPTPTSIGYDSSKVVTDVIVNATGDSVSVYKGGVLVSKTKIASSGGGGTGWNLTPNAGTDSSVNGIGTADLKPLNFFVNGIVRAKISTGNELIKYGGLSLGANAFESGIKIVASTTSAVPGISFRNTNASGKTVFFGANTDGSATISDTTGATIWAKFFNNATFLQDNIASMTGSHYLLGYNSAYTIDGLWFGISKASATSGNYSIYGDGTNTFVNSATGGDIYFRKNNGTQTGRIFGSTTNWGIFNGSTVSDDGVNKLQVAGSVKATQHNLSALNTAPTSATATGTLGETRDALDNGVYYHYLCIATNTWVRTAYATW